MRPSCSSSPSAGSSRSATGDSPGSHLPAAAWGAGIELLGGVCPLTPLENHLRRLGGEAGYPGGFVERYLLPALYPSGLTRRVEVVLGVAVLLGNAVVYALVVRRARGGSA